MHLCKNKHCVHSDDNMCSYCGYCYNCHNNKDNYDSCAFKLEYRQVQAFQYETNGKREDVEHIVCKVCNSTKWIVGQGSYFTAIKCPNCKYEVAIHKG